MYRLPNQPKQICNINRVLRFSKWLNSHDKMTRFLNGKLLGSKELLGDIKPEVGSVEKEGGALILDDSI